MFLLETEVLSNEFACNPSVQASTAIVAADNPYQALEENIHSETNFEASRDEQLPRTTMCEDLSNVGRQKRKVHSSCDENASQVANEKITHHDESDVHTRAWGEPGIQFVPWGAAGPPDRLDSMQSRSQHRATRDSIQSVTNQSANEHENVKEVKWLRKRKTIIFVSTATFLIVAAVCAAIWFTRSRSLAFKEATVMAPASSSCDLWFNDKQPNVITQCLCVGKVEIIADDVSTNYYQRKGDFIKTLLPNFNSSIDSCDPANTALIWLASGTGTPTPSASTQRANQRFVLSLLYLAWSGQWWTSNQGWFSSDDECSWIGVVCDANGQVIKLRLVGTGLHGDLRSEVALLYNLASLSLGQNQIGGTLPTELASLTNLSELLLDGNSLTGRIPTEYGRSRQLSTLIISNNRLTGSIPIELGRLSDLEELRLSNNIFNGTIPTYFDQLQKLQIIAIDNNTLTGGLPTDIGRWRSVKLIDFSLNQFAGSTLPSEIGLMTSLTSLSLTNCGIQGTLPTELFAIQNLGDFQATANHIRGTIPTQIGLLSALGTLALGENFLTGTLPSEIGNCQSLSQVLLDGNSLHGNIPSQLGRLTQLGFLDIIGNHFTGSVPNEVCATVTPTYCSLRSQLQCDCCNCPGGGNG